MANFTESPLMEMTKFKESMEDASSIALSPMFQAQRQWNPYSFQGGTTAALAGDDFVVVASDTRLTGDNDFEILSRHCEKAYILTDQIIMNACGFYGDVLEVKRILEMRIAHYDFVYQRPMSLEQCGEMFSRILYSRRFFPFFTGASICGINSEGRGAIYSFDPIGCIETNISDNASGSGGQILTTFFENQWSFSTVAHEERKNMPKQTLDRALSVIRDAFRGLSERETSTGDFLQVFWLQAGDKKVHRKVYRLRGD